MVGSEMRFTESNNEISSRLGNSSKPGGMPWFQFASPLIRRYARITVVCRPIWVQHRPVNGCDLFQGPIGRWKGTKARRTVSWPSHGLLLPQVLPPYRCTY